MAAAINDINSETHPNKKRPLRYGLFLCVKCVFKNKNSDTGIPKILRKITLTAGEPRLCGHCGTVPKKTFGRTYPKIRSASKFPSILLIFHPFGNLHGQFVVMAAYGFPDFLRVFCQNGFDNKFVPFVKMRGLAAFAPIRIAQIF